MNKHVERTLHLAASAATLVSALAAVTALARGQLLVALAWFFGLLAVGVGGGVALLLLRRPWSPVSRPPRLRFSWRSPDRALQALGLRKARYEAPEVAPLGEQKVVELAEGLQRNTLRTIVFEDDAVGPMHRQCTPALTVGKRLSEGSELEASMEAFLAEAAGTGLGYVVTPSRMSSPAEAEHIYRAAMEALLHEWAPERPFRTVLRLDSCLRGHFDPENAGIRSALEAQGLPEFDLMLVAPAYVEQGRFTLEGVQYLQDERGRIRVDESEYARFTGFEFPNSDVAAWLDRKTRGRIRRGRVTLVGLESLRTRSPHAVAAELAELPRGSVIVVDIVNRGDATAAAAVAIELERRRSVLYRSGPSLIDALTRRSDDDRDPAALIAEYFPALGPRPGLFVAGSLTSRTKVQIQELRNAPNVALITFDNDEIATTSTALRTAQLKARKVDESLGAGHHVIVTTSFWLSDDVEYPDEDIRTQVLAVYAAILQNLEVPPGWVVFKGSDTGGYGVTEGLGARSIDYLGPLFPGAGLLRLRRRDARSGYDGPVVVVAGNVGTRTGLVDVVSYFEAAAGMAGRARRPGAPAT